MNGFARSTAVAGLALSLSGGLTGGIPAAWSQDTQAAVEAAAPADSVTALLFDHDLMSKVVAPTAFDYRFDVAAADATSRDGHFRMEVREVKSDGSKSVWFKTDGSAGEHDFGPMDAKQQNPLVIVFLQMDVSRMEKLTGGSQLFFRNRIRKAFNEPAAVTKLTVDYDGRSVPATSLKIQPYRGEAHLAAFPAIATKVYEFVVADEVPGGVYKIATSAADPADDQAVYAATAQLTGTAALP